MSINNFYYKIIYNTALYKKILDLNSTIVTQYMSIGSQDNL